jgi:hypothetical protein
MPLLNALLVSLFLVWSANAADSRLTYCVPVDSFDFNPFREITQGRELAYLEVAVRSLVSTVAGEPGIIDKYSFSSDGQKFTARLRSDVKFGDGSTVRPVDVAYAIARGLNYRPLGKRLQVAGGSNLSRRGWNTRSDVGIRIIDSLSFELRFDSAPENTAGVLREALSSGSMHNRMWPVKLQTETMMPPEVLSSRDLVTRWPLHNQNKTWSFDVAGVAVDLINPSSCELFDFSYYPDFQKVKFHEFTQTPNTAVSSVIALVNPAKFASPLQREAIAKWLRDEVKSLPDFFGIKSVDSFFLKGEPGAQSGLKWQPEAKAALPTRLRVAASTPVGEAVFRSIQSRKKIDLTIVDSSEDKKGNFDVQLLTTTLKEGRYVFFQDILKWNSLERYFAAGGKLHSVLERIGKESASTIPPGNFLLQEFEKVAREEYVLIPLGRRNGSVFNRTGAPLKFIFNSAGELSIVTK